MTTRRDRRAFRELSAARRRRLTLTIAGATAVVLVGGIIFGNVVGQAKAQEAAPHHAVQVAASTSPVIAPPPPVAASVVYHAVLDKAQAHKAADTAMAVLSTYSDAEKSTEDALYRAVQAQKKALPAGLDAATKKVTTAAAKVKASALAYRAKIAAKATGGQPAGGNVKAQMAYLLKYANHYNSARWSNLNSSGGDCVNFTSQGLLARGWKMNATWRSGGKSARTSAWVLTPRIEQYFLSMRFVSHSMRDLDRVRVGDVGIFDWGETRFTRDHTMTVSKVQYTPQGPKIWFASHNSDGKYRELRHTLYTQHHDSKVWIYSIP